MARRAGYDGRRAEAAVCMRGGALRFSIRAILSLVGCCLFLFVLVQVLARGTVSLSGFEETSLEEVRQLAGAKRGWTAEELQDAIKNHKVHRAYEWPADKPRVFQEAPELAELVKQGKLPPVEQRLPDEPLVIDPPDQMGPYGGTYDRYTTGSVPRSIMYRIGYERLFRFDPMGNKFLPNLATKVEMLDGGRTWIVHLRKGVRWSDGHPWGADDLMFWRYDILGNEKLREADMYLNIKRTYKVGGKLFELDKIDDHTVRFRYAAPNGLFMMHITYDGTYMLVHQTPAHHMKKFHPDYVETDEDLKRLEMMAQKKGFAGGPYQLLGNLRDPTESDEPAPTLEAWTRNKPVVIGKPVVSKRNPYYGKVDPNGTQLPYLDRVVIHKVANLETINLKAINGQIGMQYRYIQFQNYALLMQKAYESHLPGSTARPFSIRHWVGPATVQLTPNLNHKDPVLRKLLNDKRFRIALSISIDREDIREAQFLGLGRPRQNCPTALSPFYSEKLEKAYIQYDPETANKLLDEMGLSERDSEGYRKRPDGQTLRLNLDSNEQTGFVDALQLVAQFWRAIGIKSELKIRRRDLWWERMSARLHDVDAFWYALRQIPLADSSFPPRLARNNLAGQWGAWFQHDGKKGEEPPPEMKEVMNLWRQIEQTPEFEKQVELMDQIHELKAENLWAIGLVGDLPIIAVVQDRFKNVPEVAYYDWCSKGPGNTAIECYAIQE